MRVDEVETPLLVAILLPLMKRQQTKHLLPSIPGFIWVLGIFCHCQRMRWFILPLHQQGSNMPTWNNLAWFCFSRNMKEINSLVNSWVAVEITQIAWHQIQVLYTNQLLWTSPVKEYPGVKDTFTLQVWFTLPSPEVCTTARQFLCHE